MAVTTQTIIKRYEGTGTLDPYPVDFQFLDDEDLIVKVIDSAGASTTLVLGTDYQVTGGDGLVGAVILVVAIDDTKTLSIQRRTRQIQPVDLVTTGEFPPEAIERQLDRTILILQETVGAESGRLLRVDEESDTPAPFSTADAINRFFGLDELGETKVWTMAEALIALSLNGEVLDHPLATWTNYTQRALKVPNYIGQLGTQTDNKSLWISTGLSAGNWEAHPLNDITLGGLSPSVLRPPTQSSVKTYLDAQVAAVLAEVTEQIAGLTSIIGEQGFTEVPVGGAIIWPGDPAVPVPNGYARAHGQALSRTVYSKLWQTYGTKHGSGDGSTTFNLPDARGLFCRFRDAGKGNDPDRLTRTAPALGGATGDDVGSVQGDGLKAHTHALTDAGHLHTTSQPTTNTIQQGSGTPTPVVTGVTAANTGSNTTGAAVASAGIGETRPKNFGADLLIKISPTTDEGFGTGFALRFDVIPPDDPLVAGTYKLCRVPRNMKLFGVQATVWTLGGATSNPRVRIKADTLNLHAQQLRAEPLGLAMSKDSDFLSPYLNGHVNRGVRLECSIVSIGSGGTPEGLTVWLYGQWIQNIDLPPATPTPTPPPTPSFTPTPSPSPSFTPTPTPTATPPMTPTPTPSGSPGTPSPSMSPFTPTPTPTPSFTPTPSPSATPAGTPTPSPSATP